MFVGPLDEFFRVVVMTVIRFFLPVAATFVLATFGLCGPLSAQLDGGIPLQFDSFQGLFASHSANTLKLETPDGLQSFRLLRAGETVPVIGRTEGTSISVAGQAGVDFLKRGMTVSFDAEEDNQKRHRVGVESIVVMATSGRHTHSRVLMAPIDEATGTNLYRWTVQIESLKPEQKAIVVLFNDGSLSERLTFPVDWEKTIVEYVLPDLKLAKPGDAVDVRALVLPTGNPLAIEVAIDQAQAAPAADALAAQDGDAPPDRQMVAPDEMLDQIPIEDKPGEAEVFDFDDENPAQVSPDQVPAQGNRDPELAPGGAPAFDWANPPRPLFTFPAPKGDLLRQWYKIN